MFFQAENRVEEPKHTHSHTNTPWVKASISKALHTECCLTCWISFKCTQASCHICEVALHHSESQYMCLHPSPCKHPQHPHKCARGHSSTQARGDYPASPKVCEEAGLLFPNRQKKGKKMKLFSEISNILRLISHVGVYLGDLRVGQHGLYAVVPFLWYFVLALRFSALSATEVFPGE